MDHLQNVLSYFDQQQPLCAEHDRIPKDLYREFGVKAGLRDETGKGVLAGLTNISDIRAFQYVDGVKHPADGQLLYRGYDVKDLINGSRGSRFAFEEAGYLLLFGQLPTPEQLEQFCAVLGECRTMPTNFTRDVIMKAPSHDIMNSMARSVLTLASYDPKAADLDTANVLRQSIQLAGIFPMLAVYSYHAYNHYEKDASMYIHRPDPSLSTAENFFADAAPRYAVHPAGSPRTGRGAAAARRARRRQQLHLYHPRGHLLRHRHLLGHGGGAVLPQGPAPRRCKPDGHAHDAEHPGQPPRP